MSTFSEFYQSFDTNPQKRGKQFEQFVQWFLKNDLEWSTQVDQVWLWNEYPERWGIDCGIDLVFRHKNGEIWAVQAKCYSDRHGVTKQDVDKFLSESNRSCIDKRLLIATTDRFSKHANQVCAAQEKTVVRLLLSDFERAELDYPLHFDDLPSGKRKERPIPGEHQSEAVTAVCNGFQQAIRGQLIMACGTGKTFTTLWIKEALESRNTLVLVPSLSLLAQTLREWTFAAAEPFDVLCICSDETVGERDEDESIHSVSELAFPVTSDIEDIRRFLSGSGNKVIFSTYQSSPLIADAQASLADLAFDLVIADEAHRCAGKVDSDFSTVLDNSRIIAGKRLFSTATPRVYSDHVKNAAKTRDIEIVGMDDESVFGKVMYSLSFGEAIRRNLLTDYRVVIVGVDRPMIAEWIKSRALVVTNSGIQSDAKSLATQIGLIKAFNDYDLRRVISFHSSVSRAESFKDGFQCVFDWINESHRSNESLWADYVSGAMSVEKRRRKLDRLKSIGKSQRGLLTNVRCLSEGSDAPALDGIGFIDPKKSSIDIAQAVGRAIRLSKDKKIATIVIPIFIEKGDNAEAIIDGSDFKPVWDVLNALRSHDDVLSQQLTAIRTGLGRKTGSKVNQQDLSKIIIDLPASVDSSFGDSLRTRLVEQTTSSWNFWYGLLENYVQEHGRARIPQQYATPDGFNLGTWVSFQRARKSKNQLPQERIDRLESLAGWTWDARAERWEEGFEKLQAYVNTYGNARFAQTYVSSDGFRLGKWTSHQRVNKSKHLLSQERINRLESLPGWRWDVITEYWEEAFKYLQSYAIEHGNANPPRTLIVRDGLNLGIWVGTQRENKAKSLLSQERINRLEALQGWTWDSRADRWEYAFEQLCLYVKQHGNTKLTQDYVTNEGFKLGGWVSGQRQFKSKNSLSQERINRLESLPGWSWDVITGYWEDAYKHLQSYVNQYGNSKLTQDYVTNEGFKLGGWVSSQRQNKSKNLLSQERINRLESLPGWRWDVITEYWEELFGQLQLYVSRYGSARVPRTYVTDEGLLLGNWAKAQRWRKSQNQLSQDRVDRLEALPGWVWSMRNREHEVSNTDCSSIAMSSIVESTNNTGKKNPSLDGLLGYQKTQFNDEAAIE